MPWQFANPWLLFGLLGLAIPLVVHLLHRRRAEVIDWGAMLFLEIGPRARRRLRLTEWLLMIARMLILGLIVLALARPSRIPSPATNGSGTPSELGGNASRAPRDVLLILDNSASMGRRIGDTSPHQQAIAWARDLVNRLAPGSAVGILLAREQVRPLLLPPSRDRESVLDALNQVPPPAGSSDLAATIPEALRQLESSARATRHIVILSDGQALPWHADEPGRWSLIGELISSFERANGAQLSLSAVRFMLPGPVSGADGSVEPLELAHTINPPDRPITIRAAIANAGPGPLIRSAQLYVDGRAVPDSVRSIGPIVPGSRTLASFQTILPDPGSHVLAVRLAPTDDDPQPANDEAAAVVSVDPALPVMLIDGEPGREPLTSETDFLRAALAPENEETPAVSASVVVQGRWQPSDLTNQRVLVLANVDRLDPAQGSAVERFLAGGGGVLVLPGDRTDTAFANSGAAAAWLPARLGPLQGDFTRREVVLRPLPSSFQGSGLAALGQGHSPPLGDAGLFFAYRLEPAAGATVLARLDSGTPWIVERSHRAGRVIMLAAPLDGEAGTLVVNPDFVPLVHELIGRLADASAPPAVIRAGDPVIVEIPAVPEDRKTLVVTTPRHETVRAVIESEGGRSRARLEPPGDPGVYRFSLPDGTDAFAAVQADPREFNSAPLTPGDLARLGPITFEEDPEQLAERWLAFTRQAPPRSIWQALIVLALLGLCLEVLLTRRLALGRDLRSPTR